MLYQPCLDFKEMFISHLETESNAQTHRLISNFISLDYLILKHYSIMSSLVLVNL